MDWNSGNDERNFLINKDLYQGKTNEDSLTLISNIAEYERNNRRYTGIKKTFEKYIDSLENDKLLISGKSFGIRGEWPRSISDKFTNNDFVLSIYVNYQLTRSGYREDKEVDVQIEDTKSNLKFWQNPFYRMDVNYELNGKVRYFDLSNKPGENVKMMNVISRYCLDNFLENNQYYEDELSTAKQKLKSIESGEYKLLWSFSDFYYFSTTSLILNTYGDILPNSSLIRILLTI